AFAQRLHARGFPYVSILEGGMEGIVEHLKKEGIPLEPTVIDHDPEAYQRWKEAQARRLAAALPPEGQRRESASSRAGEAFSWRGEGDGKTGNDSNSNRHYSGSSSASHQHDGRQHQREEYSGGGGGGAADGGAGADPGQSKLGVLDRLGLVRVRDGVSHGVGTVARTGAWAVRGGAGMIIPSALSADSGDMIHAQEREEGRFRGQTAPRGHARTESGNIWEDEEGADGGGGGGLNNLMNGGLVDSNDVKAILGAVKTAQAGVRDGISRGVGTVRRTGSWVAREGGIAGRAAAPPPAPASVDGGNNLGEGSADGPGRAQRLRPRSGTGSGQVGEGAGEDDADEESEEAALLVALKTAEANGHTAVAKVLRGRLGFLQGQAVRLRLARKEDSGVGGGGGSGSGPAPSSNVQPPYEDSSDLASTPVHVD
ncbi:unnamed protein product, partial [Ectocarpus sp. 12 AP-2014]